MGVGPYQGTSKEGGRVGSRGGGGSINEKTLTMDMLLVRSWKWTLSSFKFVLLDLCARWLDGFGAATPARRDVILPLSQKGAMFSFDAAPTVGHGALSDAMK